MSEERDTKGKVVLKLNASGLKTTSCDYRAWLTMVQGYTGDRHTAKIVYGIAVHKYIDTMFQTNGHIGKARDAALNSFNKPKLDDKKSLYYSDQNHMLATCFDVWDMFISKDRELETVILPPDGKPATEVTFSIQSYYEDDHIIVDLEGTIDRIGKIRGGIYVINDFKTTGTWDVNSYLAKYALSQQMRFYLLALKIMSKVKPASALGQIGATNVGYCIDGIFIKTRPSDNVYKRSEVFTVSDLESFQDTLDVQIAQFSQLIQRVKSGKQPHKNGLINGSCEGKFGLCGYWGVCKAQDPVIGQMLLDRDFIRKPYDPLHHQE